VNPTSAGDTVVQEMHMRAPATRIFEALTNPVSLVKWWTAGGRFQATHMESDLRPGGQWLIRGVSAGGRPFRVGGEYRDVDRPRLLSFTWLPDWQEGGTETLVRIDLEERDGLTTVRLTHWGLTSEGARARHRGWPELLGSLKAYVEQESSSMT